MIQSIPLYLWTFGYMSIGMGLVYCGVTFLNGQLLPGLLHGFYEAVPNVWIRLLIALFPAWGLGNFFVGKAYALGGPAVAGASLAIATVLGMVIVAMLIDNTKLNWHITAGTLVMLLSGAWVVYGLNQ